MIDMQYFDMFTIYFFLIAASCVKHAVGIKCLHFSKFEDFVSISDFAKRKSED